ncbi:hypothetical protein BDC45DRAFT_540694 [Circinella umbellata]|nr:hypothetical protein BDC45DRAFT_540694 [Circinella umbellata]
MSLTCYIYCLTLVDKKVYCLNEIGSFTYLQMLVQIKNGAIGDIIQCLTKLHVMLEDLNTYKASYSKNSLEASKMQKILHGGNKKKSTKPIIIEDWLSCLLTLSNKNDTSDEEDTNDQDDIDDEDNTDSEEEEDLSEQEEEDMINV